MIVKKFDCEVDPELSFLVAPMSREKYRALRLKIEYGKYFPVVGLNGATVVFGFNEYAVCKELQRPYEVLDCSEMLRDQLVVKIVTMEIEKKDLSEIRRRYLLGKGYRCGTQEEKRFLIGKIPSPKFKTAQRAIIRYMALASVLDRMWQLEPTTTYRILMGKLPFIRCCIEKYVDLDDRGIRELCRDYESVVKEKEKRRKEKRHSLPIQGFLTQTSRSPVTSVKEMPVFNPDAALQSLVFTMKSWTGTMIRTREATDFRMISEETRLRMKTEAIRHRKVLNRLLTYLRRGEKQHV